jgi:TatD DNase family protein
MYTDTHCHLTDTRFSGDRDAVLERAAQAQVTRLIEIGCEPASWAAALALAQQHPQVSCALGIHPHEARLADEPTWAELEKLAADPRVVAIGETGLDYHYHHSPPEQQKSCFLRHLALARQVQKPLIIHCREAYADLIPLLSEDIARNGLLNGVIHCFSGTMDHAEQFLALGFLLGIDGPVTYPKSADLRYLAEKTALENLLLESDAPYLPPQPYRGKRNEPSYLPCIAAEIASLRDTSPETVATITTKNARELFRLP